MEVAPQPGDFVGTKDWWVTFLPDIDVLLIRLEMVQARDNYRGLCVGFQDPKGIHLSWICRRA